MARTAVTLVVEHCLVNADEAARYEAWLREIIPMARTCPGHRSLDVRWPGAGSMCYTLVLRFDAMVQLQAWLDAPERIALIARIEPWLASKTMCTASGPESPGAAPPVVSPGRCMRFVVTLAEHLSRFTQPRAARRLPARTPAG